MTEKLVELLSRQLNPIVPKDIESRIRDRSLRIVSREMYEDAMNMHIIREQVLAEFGISLESLIHDYRYKKEML